MERRNDYGSDAEAYFNSLDEDLKPLAQELRSLLLDTIPNVTEVIKWGMPVYGQNGRKMWICAINVGKDYAALQFGAVGTSLNDPQGLLEGTGKKLRHVKIRSESDINKEQFVLWIQQAVEADT